MNEILGDMPAAATTAKDFSIIFWRPGLHGYTHAPGA